jgi:hypothetical protein
MNKIVILKTVSLKIDSLESNIGQIEGIPKNPRFIKDEKFKKLKRSITENPEMLGAREILVYQTSNQKYVVIGGNMRFMALKELGYKEAPCKIIPANFTPEQVRAIIIKDNVSYGDLDWEILANEWDATELNDWGVDVWIPEDNYIGDKVEDKYEPETNPTTNYKDVTAEDMDSAQNKIDDMYSGIGAKKYIECHCPNCGSEFKITL